MSVGLVLQGGGQRCAYTAGILQGLYSEGIHFDYVAGVSAGALTAISYISGQPRRNYDCFVKYASDPRYMGIDHLRATGSAFNFDFLFGDMVRDLLPFDFDAFYSSPCRLRIGTTDCVTGEAVYYDKEDLKGDGRMTVLRASSSLPIIAKVEHYEGRDLMDGGLSDPIPIEQSIEEGNEFNVIVLTRNIDYVCQKDDKQYLYRRMYPQYPKLLELLEHEHEVNNYQRWLCYELQRQGKAVVLQPTEPLKVTVYERRSERLAALHDSALIDLAGRIGDIRDLIARDALAKENK